MHWETKQKKSHDCGNIHFIAVVWNQTWKISEVYPGIFSNSFSREVSMLDEHYKNKE